MRIATMAVAYRESRLLPKHLKHLPDWIDEKLVLVSKKPWYGKELPDDGTAALAEKAGATVIEYDWRTEEDQRNAGLDYLKDYDWVIVLDPDEFLDNENWNLFKHWLENALEDAYVVDRQWTYWKNGYVATPPRDYLMLIAVKPIVRFVEKRVIDRGYGRSPIVLHHFSWAKTDEEVWNKITHYAHALDFDTLHWFNEIWMNWKPGIEDVHPTTPETLHRLVKAQLPHELERLKLWPK